MKGTARRTLVLRMAARVWWAPVVVVGALVDRGSRARWLLTPGIVVLAASASTVGKLVIRRPRPGASMRIAPLGRLGAAGFPSTHTACAFAIASWHRGSRRHRWLHLVAIGIGYLRVRRRAHYYGDVVAGAILGYGIAWQVEGLWSRFVTSRVARTVGSASNHDGVRSFGPRSVGASESRNHSTPRRDRVAVRVGPEVSLRHSGRRNGAVPARERGSAKDSALEVS
jgi:hypothetical protein